MTSRHFVARHHPGLIQMWPFSTLGVSRLHGSVFHPIGEETPHYDVKSQSYNPGLQYPHLHVPVHTPDNNRWDTQPV